MGEGCSRTFRLTMFPVVLKAPLTFLDLRFNNFTGPLPASLFTETDMDVSLSTLKPTK